MFYALPWHRTPALIRSLPTDPGEPPWCHPEAGGFTHTSVAVSVPTAPVEQRFALPLVAVQYDTLGAHIYQLNTEDKQAGLYRAKRKQITLEATDQQRALITTGVEANSLIATAGAFKLYDGILARVTVEPTDPARNP